jgi:hypothetical protein
MDTILLIMFAAVFCMTSSLTFMEVRRIRKNMELRAVLAAKNSAAGA